ncbi:MAG: transcription initiation factor IIB family protein [Halodesulfurarchaeum sp.]
MSVTDNASACPECNGSLQRDGTETICTNCGLVVDEDPIDRGPEWRNFEDGPNRERTGAPLTRSRHDRGLSTEIGRATRLTGRKRRRLARMRREHDRAHVASTAERNQIYGFTEIRRLVSSLSLPDSLRDQACVLFESAQSEDLLQGRSLEGFAAASIYAVCRTNNVARTMEEIESVSRADDGELRTAYNAMNRTLGLRTGPIDPTEYIPRYATELGIGPDLESRARSMIEAATNAGTLGGRNPSGVAAAALYTAGLEKPDGPTQEEAAAVGNVTPVTLRGAYRVLSE